MTRIRGNDRLNVALAAQTHASITEAERGIVPQNDSAGGDPAYRTLQPNRQIYSANTVYATTLGSKVSTSANLSATRSISRSLNGLAAPVAGDGEVIDPLDQRAKSTAIHLGTTLNADLPKSWRLSLTGTYDHASASTDSERFLEPQTGGPAIDQARSNTDAAAGSMLLNGKVLKLPAGDLRTSIQVGASTSSYTSETVGVRAVPERTLSRSTGNARLSIDLPVTKRNGWGSAIGSLTANVNASASRVSGFDTLTTFGFGFNWSPVSAVSVIAAINEDRRAPTVQQLNNPVLTTVNATVFDYATGQSVLVSRTAGGNPLLVADDRRTFKLGATVKPFRKPDITLSANYSDSRTRNAILSLSGVSPEIEAAFPGRIMRDENGRLEAFSAQPVNAASQERSNLRWGFSLTHILRASTRPEFNGRPPRRAEGADLPVMADTPRSDASAPQDTAPLSPAADRGEQPEGDIVVTGERQQESDGPAFPRRRPGGWAGGPRGAGGPQGGPFGANGRFGAGMGGGGPGGMGGFGRGGAMRGADDGARLQLSIYHTWMMTDQVTLRDGLAPVDLLDGNTLGGPPPSRHQVQINGGVTDNGVGIRLTGEWRSAARIYDQVSPAGDLRFGSLATFDVRLFADVGQRLANEAWASGIRVTLAVENILNRRQRVTDAAGGTPLAYQPAYLDPVGRAVLLTVRKLL